MKPCSAILLSLAVLAGCGHASIQDYWKAEGIAYDDVQAAQDKFAIYAEKAVAARESDALKSLDVLFDMLKEDEVAYYLYTEWVDGAFYSPLSPCRNTALYCKAVDRMVKDGILPEREYAPRLQKCEWMRCNLPGDKAVLPGVVPDGRKMLVLVLDSHCPSCREALTVLSSEGEDLRKVAICYGFAPSPSVPGWEYVVPDNFTAIFDPALTPVYFTVAGDGTVETPYKLAL